MKAKTLEFILKEYDRLIERKKPSLISKIINPGKSYGCGLCIIKTALSWDIQFIILTEHSDKTLVDLLKESFPESNPRAENVWPLTENGHKQRRAWLVDQIELAKEREA